VVSDWGRLRDAAYAMGTAAGNPTTLFMAPLEDDMIRLDGGINFNSRMEGQRSPNILPIR